MAVGLSIPSTGPIQYGNGTIVSNASTSLLSVFTNVSGAVPGVMSPDTFSSLGSPEPYYKVIFGPYANEYVINRNDPIGGDVFFDHWLVTGQFDIDYLHSYTHWVKDQRIQLQFQNTTPGQLNYGFKLTIPNFGIICNFSGPSPYSYVLGGYQFLPGNIAGAGGVPSKYETPSINTNWELTWTVEYGPSNNNRQSFGVDIRIIDYHTGDRIYQNTLNVGGSSNGFGYPPSVDDTFTVEYWRCLSVEVSIS